MVADETQVRMPDLTEGQVAMVFLLMGRVIAGFGDEWGAAGLPDGAESTAATDPVERSLRLPAACQGLEGGAGGVGTWPVLRY